MTVRRSRANPNNPLRTPGAGIDQAYYDALKQDNDNTVKRAKRRRAASEKIRYVVLLPADLGGRFDDLCANSGHSPSAEMTRAVRFWIELHLGNEM